MTKFIKVLNLDKPDLYYSYIICFSCNEILDNSKSNSKMQE